ncbi:MAG: PBP1A family penicillin-binding protein [Acidobacteriota bacterium]|nr:PBP1A family penicillin-binding protein [Acidobacteriota bacterium]
MRLRLPRFEFIHKALAGRPRTLMALVGVLAAVVFLLAGWGAWFSYDLTAGLPDRTALRAIGDMAQSTTILDAADKPVFTIFKEQRIDVPLERVSPNLIKAVVSVEDQRFYDHGGVDAIRVMAAAVKNFETGRRAEGGSTITQQLARQNFLSRDKTYRRKLKEVILAAYIEKMYSKDEILELYLNKVYLGDGLYGVEAAARGYLGKSASDLTVDEAALIAGLIQSPSSYAPTVNLDRAVARRNVVLQTMVSSGAIDKDAAERAKGSRVRLKNALEIKETFGLYFKEHVRRELVERFGWQRVYRGGLRVFTTLDADLQQEAEKLVEKALAEIERRPRYPHVPRARQPPAKEGELANYLQGALVAMDPSTGHVRAMVGGRDFGESRFNRAVQAKRQAGSAFKPFVYAAALEAGYSPASLITNLDQPIETPQGGWIPEDEHSTASSMTMRAALKTSSNRAAVQMLHTVGIPKAVSYAEKLNVGTPPSVPSLALGASEVTLVSLTAAYGAFANKGVVRQPLLIRKVEDADGEVLYTAEGKSHPAVSETTAFLMSSMLADVVNAGTAYRARQAGFTLPAAGKTGTTNDYVDAWFIGYTPHLVTGVWVGFDQPATITSNGYAGDLAVPLWANFMKVATKGNKADWFDRPPGILGANVCRVSGKLPNDGCNSVEVVSRSGDTESRSMIYTEYFVKGTQPTTVCTLHPSPSLMDRLAGLFGGGPPEVPAAPERASIPVERGTSGVTDRRPPPAGSAGPDEIRGGTTAEEPVKKRGFWAKVFGKDDKNNEDRKKEDKKKPER